jgi:hypothetical protein
VEPRGHCHEGDGAEEEVDDDVEEVAVEPGRELRAREREVEQLGEAAPALRQRPAPHPIGEAADGDEWPAEGKQPRREAQRQRHEQLEHEVMPRAGAPYLAQESAEPGLARRHLVLG